MAWRRPGNKPLSETMLFSLKTHICVTRPQWVDTPNAVKYHEILLAIWVRNDIVWSKMLHITMQLKKLSNMSNFVVSNALVDCVALAEGKLSVATVMMFATYMPCSWKVKADLICLSICRYWCVMKVCGLIWLMASISLRICCVIYSDCQTAVFITNSVSLTSILINADPSDSNDPNLSCCLAENRIIFFDLKT